MPGQHLEAGVRLLPGAAVLELRGEVDGFAEEALDRAYTLAEQEDPAAVLLDMGGVRYINSKGIALLVVLLIRARQDRRQILAFGLGEHFQEIFRITRLSDYIGLYDDEESALAGVVWAGGASRKDQGNGARSRAEA